MNQETNNLTKKKDMSSIFRDYIARQRIGNRSKLILSNDMCKDLIKEILGTLQCKCIEAGFYYLKSSNINNNFIMELLKDIEAEEYIYNSIKKYDTKNLLLTLQKYFYKEMNEININISLDIKFISYQKMFINIIISILINKLFKLKPLKKEIEVNSLEQISFFG